MILITCVLLFVLTLEKVYWTLQIELLLHKANGGNGDVKKNIKK